MLKLYRYYYHNICPKPHVPLPIDLEVEEWCLGKIIEGVAI